MASRYEYRRLMVTLHDKHEGAAKQRRGNNTDRFLEIEDSAHPTAVRLADRDGDDLKSFLTHVNASFITYLNALGAEGWKLVQYHHESWGETVTGDGMTYPGYDHFRRVQPWGTYLLMRATEVGTV